MNRLRTWQVIALGVLVAVLCCALAYAWGYRTGLMSDTHDGEVLNAIGTSRVQADTTLKELNTIIDKLDRVLTGPGRKGIASFYAEPFHGRTAADGSTYDMHDMSAASRELPLGSWAIVQNLGNGKTVVVQIRDRGPYIEPRIIDMSFAAAQALDMVSDGVAVVRITPIPSDRHAMLPAQKD